MIDDARSEVGLGPHMEYERVLWLDFFSIRTLASRILRYPYTFIRFHSKAKNYLASPEHTRALILAPTHSGPCRSSTGWWRRRLVPLLLSGQGSGQRRGGEQEEAEGVVLGGVGVEVEEGGAVPDQVLLSL